MEAEFAVTIYAKYGEHSLVLRFFLLFFFSFYFCFFSSLVFFPLFTPFPSLSRSIDVFSFKRMYDRAIVGTRLGFSREIEFERRSDYHGQVKK